MEPTIGVTDLSEPGLDESLSPVQKAIIEDSGDPAEYKLPKSGKIIRFKEPDGMASYHIAKMMGQNSLNPALNIFFRVAFCIDSVDGVKVKTPKNELEVEAIVARLAKTNEWDETVLLFNQWCGIGEDGERTEDFEDPAKK